MRIVKTGDLIRMQFDAGEIQILFDLISELVDEFDVDGSDAGPSDAVQRRLFPAAYPDADQEQGFREMTEAGLRADRVERAEQCLADLTASPLRTSALTRRARQEVALSLADGDRWIRVLTDLRLVLGTRLEITEDVDPDDVEADDPEALSYALYAWLTGVQDTLVRALMGSVP